MWLLIDTGCLLHSDSTSKVRFALFKTQPWNCLVANVLLFFSGCAKIRTNIHAQIASIERQHRYAYVDTLRAKTPCNRTEKTLEAFTVT